MQLTKVIDIKDFKNPEMTPYLLEVAALEAATFKENPRIIPDSKQWECAMALRTFEKAGILDKRPVVAGIGAGTEATIYALANRDAVVFPADKYLEPTPWSDVAPAGFMLSPEHYAKLPVKRTNIIPVSSDCTDIRLPSDFFDGVFSSGSIEHFGSLEKVEQAAREISRILKPGGVASISTEFRLEGPYERAWFDDDVILFTDELLRKHIVEAGDFELIDGDFSAPSDETYQNRVDLEDFLNKVRNVRTYRDKESVYPNTVIFHQGFLFCSVHLALRKKTSAGKKTGKSPARQPSKSEDPGLASLADRLSGLQRANYVPGNRDVVSSKVLECALFPGQSPDLSEAQQKIDILLNSTSWRITRPMRIVGDAVKKARRVIKSPGQLRAQIMAKVGR